MKVRDVIKRIKADGWYFKRMHGDHQIFHHPTKPGIVVVAGQPRDDVPIGTLREIWRGGIAKDMSHYTLILEHGPASWGAYSPDLPGCIAAARTRSVVEKRYAEAAEGWIEATLEAGGSVPVPQTETEMVTVTLSGYAPRRYLVILQPTPLGNWSATPADVPDLVLEFSTRAETLHLLRAALQSHLETLLAAGQALPEPASEAATVSVRLSDARVAA